MIFQSLDQLSHEPRFLVSLGIVLWICAYYYNKKVLSPFQYSIFAIKPILFCTMVFLFLAFLLLGNQTSMKDLYWLIYIAGTFSYNRSLCLQSQEDELVSCYYQCVIPAVVIRCLCGNLNNNIDYAYYMENLQ